MKKIVVIEDRPWQTRQITLQLQREGKEFYRMIYYPNRYTPKEKEESLLQEYKEATKIPIDIVQTQGEFVTKMNELYDDEELVFLMDYDLKGEMNVTDFFSRINIKYAMDKGTDHGTGKIWFYTTGGPDVKSVLLEKFSGRVINAPKFEAGQLEWKIEDINHMVGT